MDVKQHWTMHTHWLQFVHNMSTDIILSSASSSSSSGEPAPHSSWNSNCVVHQLPRNGEGTPPFLLFWRRSTASSVFPVGTRGRALTLLCLPPPPPPPPRTPPHLSPSLTGHLASVDVKQNVYLLTSGEFFQTCFRKLQINKMPLKNKKEKSLVFLDSHFLLYTRREIY